MLKVKIVTTAKTGDDETVNTNLVRYVTELTEGFAACKCRMFAWQSSGNGYTVVFDPDGMEGFDEKELRREIREANKDDEGLTCTITSVGPEEAVGFAGGNTQVARSAFGRIVSKIASLI